MAHVKNELNELVANRVLTGDRQILRTVREWKTSEGHLKAFYFRSELCHGEDVPVYAVMGVPKGAGRFPGVLHYHGGGQTANPAMVEELVRNGYAAISFDWTGPVAGREHVTLWNGCIPRYSGFNPDESLLIRALTAGRQALSILSEHPRVDPSRLGEFGISWGGFQTWLLNAVDDRLRAAVAIYGCGITRSQALFYFRDETKQSKSFDVDAWLERFNPIHYVHTQKAPVLFLNGTNDFFGWMNTFDRLAAKLDDRHQAAFASHLNHGIATLNPTLIAWLDHHLRGGKFPQRPVVTGEWTWRGIELRSVALPDAESASFHIASISGVGPDFFWFPVAAKRSGRFFTAWTDADLLDASRVMVYVHQRLRSGVELSSFPIRLAGVPGQVTAPEGGVMPLTLDLWYGPTPTNPLEPFTPLHQGKHIGRTFLEWKTGSDLNFSFNTRVIALPRYRMRSSAHIRCHLRGPVAEPITLAVLQYAGSPRERHFVGRFSRTALAKGISLGALKDSKGTSLRAGTLLSHLYIGGTTRRPATVRLELVKIIQKTLSLEKNVTKISL